MENNIVTLETARKLKAAGFPQDDVEHSWADLMDNDPIHGKDGWTVGQSEWFEGDIDFVVDGPIAALTAQEIADQLPNHLEDPSHHWLTLKATQYDNQRLWLADYEGTEGYSLSATGDTMAEALASLWLKLHEGDTK